MCSDGGGGESGGGGGGDIVIEATQEVVVVLQVAVVEVVTSVHATSVWQGGRDPAGTPRTQQQHRHTSASAAS